MNDHRVQRVLHLVRDSRSDAAEVSQFLREVPLRLELLKRFIVANTDKRAYRLTRVFDVLDRSQELAGRSAGQMQSRACYRLPLIKRALDGCHQRMIGSECLVYRQSRQLNTGQA